MTHSEKIKSIRLELGVETPLKWRVLKEHGVERCCGVGENRKTKKTRRCCKAINFEFGEKSSWNDNNGSYCKNHARIMDAMDAMYNMDSYE
tara:strand:+ start:164 stop:436 length:273 start_codon:yes stop_codon:yes gene_type:complete